MFHSEATLCNSIPEGFLRPVRALLSILTEFLVYLGLFLNAQPLLFTADSLLGNKFPFSQTALAQTAAHHSTSKLVESLSPMCLFTIASFVCVHPPPSPAVFLEADVVVQALSPTEINATGLQ